MERLRKGRILHQITIHNGIVYTAGLIADDLNADMSGQTEQLCEKIDALLAEAGSEKSKIIRVQIFVTDISKKPEMDAVWLKWIGDVLPSRCTVGVADLGDPRILLEAVVTAVQ